VIHFVAEAKGAGPIRYRWMHPIKMCEMHVFKCVYISVRMFVN